MNNKVKRIDKVEVEVEVDVDYFISGMVRRAEYDQLIKVMDDIDEEVGDTDFTEDVLIHFLDKMIKYIDSEPDAYAGTSWSMLPALRGLVEKESK